MLFKDGVCSIYHPQKGKIAQSIMSANRLFILRTEPSTTQQMKEDASKFQIWISQHFGTIVMVISARKACAP